MTVQHLADQLTLGGLLDELRRLAGPYELVDHWKQGEFHHDTVLRVDAGRVRVPGPILIVATNCNGGVKEVLCFEQVPDRSALWHRRCPDNPEFAGEIVAPLASSRTLHWFDPCDLLKPDARSEYRPEFRERQQGGGWQMKSCGTSSSARMREEESA
ncbi:MAG TPA: hypothetical protein VJV78_30160 [Polyangiales bacterium]|nr:hypothetical protein [Polyangiales bacterium]